MLSTVLIIGGGQAGAQAVDTLRREGYGGRIALIGDEPHLPYQRPPCRRNISPANSRPTGCPSGTGRSTTSTGSSSSWVSGRDGWIGLAGK